MDTEVQEAVSVDPEVGSEEATEKAASVIARTMVASVDPEVASEVVTEVATEAASEKVTEEDLEVDSEEIEVAKEEEPEVDITTNTNDIFRLSQTHFISHNNDYPIC